MSEWQPAIYLGPHPDAANVAAEYGLKASILGKKKIFVRPATPNPATMSILRKMGCTATKFYEVRSDLCVDSAGDRTGCMVCEEQIQTD